MSVEITHERIESGGIHLHVARAGAGPPVILLHGFPENWTSWRHQIRSLSAAGFEVWAPDLRGYNESDRPKTRQAYELSQLVEDVAALVKATGRPKAHIVGHDWGGIVAWAFAGERPDLVDRLVILNAPHLQLYREKLWFRQMFRSWYVLFFQLPLLPEWLLQFRRAAMLRRLFRKHPARKGTFDDKVIDAYVGAFAAPGAMTAALNYYRQNFRPRRQEPARRARTDAPTLVIWGELDRALGTELLEGLERVAPKVRIHRIADAGHWVQNEASDEVNRVLISFLKEGGEG